MGDYSRNTFELTNVMHQVLGGETVSDARQYVGVRLQQAVPLLESDWNEIDDIRRLDSQINLRHYFGDGIPSDNFGFKIGAVTDDNDFTINLGMALVSGMLVLHEHIDLTYLEQATIFDITVDSLLAPVVGSREDLVYLDVWHEEIASSGENRIDDRLVNPAIGVETCLRIERRWLVRVATGVTDLSDIVEEADHAYMALAKLQRVSGNERITADQIIDLRRIDINVAKYLKIPMSVERDGDIVDSERFAILLDSLRKILLERLSDDKLFLTGIAEHNRNMMHFSLQQIIQACNSGALQARTKNLTNTDGIQVLLTLVTEQKNFLNSLITHGMGGVAMDSFIDDYSTPRLDDVETAVNDEDLLEAYKAQQVLNSWLSADVGALPEGGVTLEFLAVDPAEPLVAGTTYTVFVEVTSGVTASDSTSEVFDVTATLSSDLWQLLSSSVEITLDNVGGAATTGTVSFDVIPNAANLISDLTVVATVQRNPTITTSQLPLELAIGTEPLTGGVLQYAGPPLNASNRIELSAASLTSGFGTSIGFALNNNTNVNHEYFVEWFITLSVGDETNWTPITGAIGTNSINVNSNVTSGLPLNISAPTGADVVGNIGTLHVTLIGQDGVNPLPVDDQEILTIDFEAV